MQKSLTTLLITYLDMQEPNGRFNFKQIFGIQDEATEYYNKAVNTPEFIQKLKSIKEKHGFTEETWKDTLTKAGSFYFLSTPEIEACNEEIARECRKYDFINSPAVYPNYLASLLNNATKTKKPKIGREKIEDHWAYYLIK